MGAIKGAMGGSPPNNQGNPYIPGKKGLYSKDESNQGSKYGLTSD
jgi:hypothetical protein